MLDRFLEARRLHLLLVLLVAAAIALPALGWSGLSSSEGHRAVPGWTMLQTGDWLHVRLFEQPYFRKPPGMPWAIAISSWLLGTTETAARMPSALGFIAMSGLACWFSRRWFGGVAGLIGGLFQALLPAMWPWARSAEIELLNTLATQAAMFFMVDMLFRRPAHPGAGATPPPSGRDRLPWSTLFLAASIVLMMLFKGPSGIPALIAALVGVCLATRSTRPLRDPALWSAIVLSLLGLAQLWWSISRENAAPETVTQDAGEFLWGAGKLGSIALLPFSAVAASLPASLGLLWCWDRIDRASSIARALGLGFLVTLGLSVVLGISNHRYLLPAMPLLPPLLGYAAQRIGSLPRVMPGAGLGAGLVLRTPLLLPMALLAVAAVMIPLSERSRERNSGRAAGLSLAHAVAEDSCLEADQLIDARPEVLWYLHTARPGARIIWSPHRLRRSMVPKPGTLLLLRDDAGSDEYARFRGAESRGELLPLSQGRFASYSFRLLRVSGAPGAARTRDE